MKLPIKILLSACIYLLISSQPAKAVSFPVNVVCDLAGPRFEGTIEGPLSIRDWEFSCGYSGIDTSTLYGKLETKSNSITTLTFNGMTYRFRTTNLYFRASPNMNCTDIEADFLANGLSNYFVGPGDDRKGHALFSSTEYANVKMNALLIDDRIIPYSFGRPGTDFTDCNIEIAP